MNIEELKTKFIFNCKCGMRMFVNLEPYTRTIRCKNCGNKETIHTVYVNEELKVKNE